MFETIRQSKSVMVFLLGLLVVAFVFVGVSGYTQLDSEGPVVAELERRHHYTSAMGPCA